MFDVNDIPNDTEDLQNDVDDLKRIYSEEKNKESIYKSILLNITDGELPQTFKLNKPYENKVGFIDGAMDGIEIYNRMYKELSQEGYYKMEELIKTISRGDYKNALKQIQEFSNNNPAVQRIYDYQSYIKNNSNSLSAGNFLSFAINQLTTSNNIEIIKYALLTIELLSPNCYSEKTKEVIKTLALCNEFTLFAILVIRHWENSNEIIFDIAKRTTGWGRIHAIDYLEVTNDEILKWLLTEGINSIVPEYTAPIIFQKVNVPKRLETCNEDELKNLSKIIEIMLKGKMNNQFAKEMIIDNKFVLDLLINRIKYYNLENDYKELIETVMSFNSEIKQK